MAAQIEDEPQLSYRSSINGLKFYLDGERVSIKQGLEYLRQYPEAYDAYKRYESSKLMRRVLRLNAFTLIGLDVRKLFVDSRLDISEHTLFAGALLGLTGFTINLYSEAKFRESKRLYDRDYNMRVEMQENEN